MSVIEDEDRVWRARCAESPDGWPFDADRDAPLTACRIAVTGSHPGWCFLVAFHRESEARPTDHEADLLVSFLDQYKDFWYGQRRGVAAAPRRSPAAAESRRTVSLTAVERAAWDAWNALPDNEPSPVKRTAAQLGMEPCDVAFVVYPAETFGPWTDAQEMPLCTCNGQWTCCGCTGCSGCSECEAGQ